MGRPVQKYLVVARYKEDVGWLSGIPGWNHVIIQKDTENGKGDLPNTGRESSSYFYAILKHYDTINSADVWAFVQGRPFDHCVDFSTALGLPVDGFRWLGNASKTTDGEGRPDHPGLPVEKKHGEWLGKEMAEPVLFAPGGQHITTGERILRHPKSFYTEVMRDFNIEYNAWVGERLWEEIYK